VKELVKRWYPDVPKWRNNSGHRALGDIRGSIGELSYYRENIFLND
jgi:oligoribonuclease